MGYTFYNITSKKEYDIELPDCTITGNSAEYKIKDGQITKYSIMDGEIDESSGENVDRIELTNYQLSFIDTIRKQDGNSDKLDKKDLELLNKESLYEKMDSIYSQTNVYKISNIDIDDNYAKLNLTDSNSSSKHISIEIEEPSFWEKICNFFKPIVNWFKSLFSSDDKPEVPQEEKVEKNVEEKEEVDLSKVFKNVDILPGKTHVVKKGDTASDIALDYGVSLNRTRGANPELQLDSLQIGQKIKLPEKVIVNSNIQTNFSSVAETTGVSENYINDILIGVEGDKKEPLLRADYDRVKSDTDDKGTITVGFGHTGRLRGKPLKLHDEITEQEAYQLLAQDIIDAKLDAIGYLGQDFLDAPKSIQDAIVDIFFNKGIKAFLSKTEDNKVNTSPTAKIKEYLKNKDYVNVAKHVIYETPIDGLRKRNIYRLCMATKDLSQEDRLKVLCDKEVVEYCNTTIELFHGKSGEQRLMSKALENARNGICEGFFN